MAPPLLTLQDIHLTFGGTPLLEGAELSISERERVCLVGRNGSGKSTLLKIAAGRGQFQWGAGLAPPGAPPHCPPPVPDLPGLGPTPPQCGIGRPPRAHAHPPPAS